MKLTENWLKSLKTVINIVRNEIMHQWIVSAKSLFINIVSKSDFAF